jgi:hypothetical protein
VRVWINKYKKSPATTGLFCMNFHWGEYLEQIITLLQQKTSFDLAFAHVVGL